MNIRVIGGILALLLLIGSTMVFTVDEREYAIKFRFGEIMDSEYEPGLHLKLPIVNNVRKFSRQILTITNPQELFLTFEKKNLLVDFFVKWRIADVDQFYRSTGGDETLAAQRLLEIVKDGIRNEFARRTVPQVVSAERRELMGGMLERARESAKELGIQVVDVRVKRTEFPDQVSESVYARMRQERARVASELRAEGAEMAEQIRAEADRTRTVILAEAYRDAEKIRGIGDAESAEIYAQVFEKDPDFYAFYRSLDAYQSSLGTESDLLVLDAASDFFRFLDRPEGQRR